MEGAAAQIVFPILGIVAAAAATFYAVSFMEIREVRTLLFVCLLSLSVHAMQSTVSLIVDAWSMVQKSLEELDEKYSEYEESGGRQRRARRRSGRQAKKRND